MASSRPYKRSHAEFSGGHEGVQKVYKFKILLPNGTSTNVILRDPGEEILLDEFILAIRKEVEKAGKSVKETQRKILWKGDIHLEDMSENVIKKKIHFNRFRTNECHMLRLNDGAGESVETFQNMWDLTPDTDLLSELPAEYTFETALADLIDNSLQAVWSNAPGERKLVRSIMTTLRNLKIKTSTCKRILKELHSYEKEVEKEAAKTADMKEKGADPYDLKQQENVLAESRMMIPDCRKRLEASLADLKETLAEVKESNQQGAEIDEAASVISELEAFFQNSEA